MGKNKIITIVLIIIFILALIGGTIWYQNIRKDYEGKEVKQNEQIGNTNGTGEKQKGTNKAKNFSIYDEQGNKVTLDTLKGKPVIINVWTSWCSYCKEEMPDFEELYQQYKDQVQFLMVNVLDGPSETIQNGKKFLQDYHYTFPYYYDKDFDLIYAYNLSGYPNTIFIDENSNLIKIHYGLITKEKLITQINQLLEK